MQKSKIKNQSLGAALPQPIEELAEEMEERGEENKESPKMKISGRKVFDLKRIIETNRHSERPARHASQGEAGGSEESRS